MRIANRIGKESLQDPRQKSIQGISTADIDRLAIDLIRKKGVKSAFKGYQIRKGVPPFPANICISLNDEVVHGIPSSQRIVKEGDVVSLDFGIIYKDFYGDSALTFSLGKQEERVLNLIEVTNEALVCGITQACVGNRIGDISAAVQERVERDGFSVVREFVGHGVGRRLHEDPPVPNYGMAGRGVDRKSTSLNSSH